MVDTSVVNMKKKTMSGFVDVARKKNPHVDVDVHIPQVPSSFFFET